MEDWLVSPTMLLGIQFQNRMIVTFVLIADCSGHNHWGTSLSVS